MDLVNLEISDYMKGVLFGDGQILANHKKYLFCTTRIDLKNKVICFLNENKIDYYIRKIEFSGDKENYEDIYKIFIDNQIYYGCLKDCYLNLSNHLNYGFLLGYIETKGSFFQYTEKRDNICIKRWRLSLSGEKSVLELIKNYFEKDNIYFTNLVHRKERESEGVISKSYRMYLNRRKDLRYLVDNLVCYDCTDYLKLSFFDFIEFDNSTPFLKCKEYYKNYRFACNYLMKELGVCYKGNKTENVDGTYIKKIYRYVDGKAVDFENGWEGVYKKLLAEYEKRYNLPGPKVLL